MTIARNRAPEHWLMPLLWKAYKKARKGKRGTLDEQRFERHADVYLTELLNEIENRSYVPSPGIAFIVHKPVIREIFAAPFRDRVVHHLLFDLTAPWWEKHFIYDSYSCRKGKGTLFGIKRLDHHIRSESRNYAYKTYVLKLDIQGYFMSLPRQGLFEVAEMGIRRQFGTDTKLYRLCRFLWTQIIFDDPIKQVKIRGTKREWAMLPKHKSLFYASPGCGIVIGNLTSQLLSNMYLDQLDKYVSCVLGFKHYGRYVDDFYIIHKDRNALVDAQRKIDAFLRGIGLTLHPKKVFLQDVSHGVAFLGAVIYPYRIHPSRRIKTNMQKAMQEYVLAGGNALPFDALESQKMISYHGLIQHHRHKKMWMKEFEKAADFTDLGGLRTD